MTIDSGAMQETKPWTSFAKAADIPDWISQAYIESYRGPHGGEPEAPEVPAASPSVDAAVPAALVTPAMLSEQYRLGQCRAPGESCVCVYSAGDPGEIGPSLQVVTDHGGMLMDSITVLLHRLGVSYTAIMAPVFEAVSYTHLDVYKRQGCSPATWRGRSCGGRAKPLRCNGLRPRATSISRIATSTPTATRTSP